MRTYCFLLMATALVGFSSLTLQAPLNAGEPKDTPPTLMLSPGKLLVNEDLHQPFGKEWFGNPGKWEVVDGVTRGSERTEDMHGAVRRRSVRFDHAVVQFQFRLEGAKLTTLSMNAEKGHVCRVKISTEGFSIVRDANKVKKEKPVVLDNVNMNIEPNIWHTLIVEMSGKDMVAKLDGKAAAFGSHDDLATTKHSVGFTVQGESVSFKNLRVYEAAPMKSWDATKAKLLAERKK